MHEALSAANTAISMLNAVSPEWYIGAVGPLTNVAIHFIKIERQEQAKLNPNYVRVLSFALPILAGAFYGVLHTPAGQGWENYATGILKDTALVGSPIYVIAIALYYKVSKKLEERHELIRGADGQVVINPEDPEVIDEAPAVDGLAGVAATRPVNSHVDF